MSEGEGESESEGEGSNGSYVDIQMGVEDLGVQSLPSTDMRSYNMIKKDMQSRLSDGRTSSSQHLLAAAEASECRRDLAVARIRALCNVTY